MNAQRQIYSDGALAVEGGNIVAVGPSDEIMRTHSAAHVIDGRGMLAVPGLIDGHNHPNQYLSNGIGDDVDILTWLYKRIYPYESVLTPEDAYISAMGAYVESIKNGATCFNDPGGLHPDAMAQAAVDVGIRGIMNRSTRDIFEDAYPVPDNIKEDTETNLHEAETFVKRWNGAADGRLRAWFSLRYVFNVSDELACGAKALADRHGVGLHAHAAAIKGENEAMYEITGKRSLERYYDLGLFGPNLYLVHMGFPDDREVELLKRHDCKVAHCPSASMLGAYGVIYNRQIPRMINAGITVALGTDSASAGGYLDMVRVMYLGACVHKDAYADATLMGAYKALEMATIDGARACLWEDEIGSLEAGKRADITLVDMSGIEWHPGRHPVTNLVYSATGRSVDTVIIDGHIVMRKRVLLTVDEERLKHQLVEASGAWRQRAGVSIPSPWPVI